MPFSFKQLPGKKILFGAFFVFISMFDLIQSSHFENDHNHYSNNEIKEFQICGERDSGTNYIKHLLLKNSGLKETRRFGWKHFLWWHGTPIDKDKLRRLEYPDDAVTLVNSENCLFIFIVRDPYDWLRSFFLEPHHVNPGLLNKGFGHFIRAQWEIEYPQGIIDNVNPWTNQPFKDVLELRRYKTKNYLYLGTLISNYLFVRYEDVRENPQQFLDFVSKTYNLHKLEKFTPITQYWVGSHPRGDYQLKTYFPIEQEDLDFINLNLDWEVENRLGYFKKESTTE